MFRRIVFSALLSGLAAGLLITAIQLFTVIPMVLQAETYESSPASMTSTAGEDGHDHHAQGHAGHDHHHDASQWAPSDGTERTFYTALTNTLAAIGFALLLGACFALFNHASWSEGLLWGLGGFAAFQLAPALGLPPELPGTAAADIDLRQLWWLATVTATAGGLALVVFGKHVALRGLGAALIVLPHLVGAPHPEAFSTSVPPELASAFVIETLAVGAVFWLMLGGLTAFAFNKLK